MAQRVDPLEDPSLLPSQAFTTAAALLQSVDRKVIVSLRDGRKLFGVLRSYDQFANLVLQDTIERIYLNDSYGEEKRGLYIVRGENVALLGEIDMDKEDILEEQRLPGSTSALKKIEFKEIERLFKEDLKKKRLSDRQREKKLNAQGFNNEPFVENLY